MGVAFALAGIQLFFERFNPQRLLAQLRFRMQGALFGGRTLLPLLLYHFNHAKNQLLEGRKVIRAYGQHRVLRFLIRAFLLFVLFLPVYSLLAKFPEDGKIVGNYCGRRERRPRTICAWQLTVLFQSQGLQCVIYLGHG